MTIQDHLSLEGINDDNLSIFKAIGVDYVAVMHPRRLDPMIVRISGKRYAKKSNPTE